MVVLQCSIPSTRLRFNLFLHLLYLLYRVVTLLYEFLYYTSYQMTRNVASDKINDTYELERACEQ